jgi:cell division protease FtsH
LQTESPKDPKLQKKRLHFSIWYVVAAVLMVVTVQSYVQEQQETIKYSDFRNLVREGKVESVHIASNGHIHGTLKPEPKPDGGKATARLFRTQQGGLEDPKLIELLEERKVPKYDGEDASIFGDVLLAYIVPLGIMVAFWFLLMRRMGGGPEHVLSLGKSKAKIYAETDIKTSFKDVAGADEAVEEVREIVDFLRSPEKFKRLGAQIPKGVLLVGFPGTGKTLIARALAGEAKVPFFHLSGSDFVEMFAGLGAARVRDLFKQAKEKAPCIIFIDEMDALGKTRTNSMVGSHEEREQTLNALLVEMDGFEANNGVVLIAATNRPEILDPALLRPGRFDRQVVVDRPDQNGRLDILKVHAKNKKLGTDVELKIVAQRTVGMVGADLAAILNEAALLAGRTGREQINMRDIDEAIDRVQAGLEKKKRVLTKKEREIVAFHEAGHAVIGKLLPGTEKNVHKVSIVPRGPAALGLTWYKEAEDRYIRSRQEIEDSIVMTFGGRAAEEVVFGEISTGAASDIEKATDTARRMVVELGMSERLGLINYDGDKGGRFLDIPGMGGPKRYSEETAREIDLELKRIIDHAHTKAKDILSEHRDALERVARRLLEVEVIDRDELERLIRGDGQKASTAPAAPTPGGPAPAA